MFLETVQVPFTNIYREKQNLPPIANKYKSKLDRILSRIYNPELEISMMEADIGPWIDQCNSVFVDPIDDLSVVLRKDSLALMCAGLDMFTCLDDARAHVDKTSITQELLFPARNIFIAAHLVQLAKGESILGTIQERITSFRKHQLSICAGFNLLDSIISFAIAVKFVCALSVFDQVGLLLSYLLLVRFKNHSIMFSYNRCPTTKRRTLENRLSACVEHMPVFWAKDWLNRFKR
jgi:hypothetical protein